MQSAREKRALDLFCGTKSVIRTLEELGYEVTTLDVRPECKADYTIDIRKWKYWTTCRGNDAEPFG